MSDDSPTELHALRVEFERMVGNIRKSVSRHTFAALGMTDDEITGWVQNEPDFQPKTRPRDKLTPYLLGSACVE